MSSSSFRGDAPVIAFCISMNVTLIVVMVLIVGVIIMIIILMIMVTDIKNNYVNGINHYTDNNDNIKSNH